MLRSKRLVLPLALLLAALGSYLTLTVFAGPSEAERAEIRASVAGLGLDEARDFAATCLEAAGDEDESTAASAADRAAALFESHLEARPDDVEALLDLAQVTLGCRIPFAGMMARGALAAEAESLYRRALDADPHSLRAHLDYGVLLYHLPPFLRRTGDAVAQLRWVAERSEAPAAAFVMLGELHRRAEDEETALAVWRRGLERHPESQALRERVGGPAPPEGRDTESSPTMPATETATMAEVATPPPLDAAFRGLAAQPMAVGLSVAVATDDEILALGGYGLADLEHSVPASADTVYRLGSVSKQFTAVLVLRLVERGRLRLDQRLDELLDTPGRFGEATLHQVLSHTAGLPENPVGFELGGHGGHTEGWLERSLDQEPVGAPGERYLYSNLGYGLLGEVVEQATGEDFEALMEREIFARHGLAATHFCDEQRIVPHRADGYQWRGDGLLHDDRLVRSPALRAAGGLCSNVRDLLTWQRALRGGEVLSPEMTERMATPAAVADGESSYGYGLHRRLQNGLDVIHHGGHIPGFVAELAYYPAADLHVVMLANSEAIQLRPTAAAVATGVVGALGGGRQSSQ